MKINRSTSRWRRAIYLHSLAFFLAADALWGQTCGWSIVPSPNSTLPSNFLSDISVLSANDIWAVGGSGRGTRIGNPLTEHWNGATWAIVPAPQPADSVASFGGVSAFSSNDVWAVGSSVVGNAASKTLIEHWDGSAWTIVPSPSVDMIGAYPADNRLADVVAIAPNDVWAVGTATTIVSGEGITLHWDGNTWTIVSNPLANPRYYDANLLGITALGSNNVWAVGQKTTTVERNTIEQWNGNRWSIVASPGFPTNVDFLLGVSAISATDIWAVGTFTIPDPEGSPYQNGTMHWDGAKWSIVTAPQPDEWLDILAGVTAISSNDVWAVGFVGTGTGYEQPEALHWDGAAWNLVPTPGGSKSTVLVSVDAVSSSDVWAVGSSSSGKRTLIEHFTCQ